MVLTDETEIKIHNYSWDTLDRANNAIPLLEKTFKRVKSPIAKDNIETVLWYLREILSDSRKFRREYFADKKENDNKLLKDEDFKENVEVIEEY